MQPELYEANLQNERHLLVVHGPPSYNFEAAKALSLSTTSGFWPSTVCDLGTGCGYNLGALREFYVAKGMDFSSEAIRFSAKRGIEVLPGYLPDDLPFSDASFDALMMLNVLEHLDDDVASLCAAARLVRPGGLVLCTLPEYQCLWNKKDDYYHHRRRYTLRQMRTLVTSAGLSLLLGSYYTAFLFPLAAAVILWRKVASRRSWPPRFFYVKAKLGFHDVVLTRSLWWLGSITVEI